MIRLNRIEKFISLEKQSIKQIIKPELKQGTFFHKKVYQKYLHSYETRTAEQIKATNEQIKKITTKNLERLSKINTQPYKGNEKKFQNCIFICLSGIPPFVNEFQNLNLPGKTYQIVPNGFQFDKSDQYREKNLQKCRLSENASNIRKVMQQNPGKEVIFVYHSFGTYSLSFYFHKYGAERVKGLIQIGAAPVRHYLYVTEVINHILRYSQDDIASNKDQIAGQRMTKLMQRVNKQVDVRWDNFPSISYSKSFLHYFKSPEIPILFDLNRRYPNILKLMIFGQDDKLFETQLVCQRASFYSKQKLRNEDSLKKKFNEKYGKKPQNIQQEFIYMIPKGKHSVHLQKKNKETISKAVQEYLELIFN